MPIYVTCLVYSNYLSSHLFIWRHKYISIYVFLLLSNTELDSNDRVCNVPELYLCTILSNIKLGMYEMHGINRQWLLVVVRQQIELKFLQKNLSMFILARHDRMIYLPKFMFVFCVQKCVLTRYINISN